MSDLVVRLLRTDDGEESMLGGFAPVPAGATVIAELVVEEGYRLVVSGRGLSTEPILG